MPPGPIHILLRLRTVYKEQDVMLLPKSPIRNPGSSLCCAPPHTSGYHTESSAPVVTKRMNYMYIGAVCDEGSPGSASSRTRTTEPKDNMGTQKCQYVVDATGFDKVAGLRSTRKI